MADPSWTRFCEGLLAAGATVEEIAADRGPLDRAEGNAQLAGLLEQALRWHLRGDDPDHPRFVEINDTPELADNLFAVLRGGAAYRITGDVAGLFDFNISLHTNWGWLGPSRVSGDLGRKQLAIDASGRFELVLSSDRRDGNWLCLPDDAAYVQIREYYADYQPGRPGIFTIERLDLPPGAPARPSPGAVDRALAGAVAWARSYIAFHQRSTDRLFPAEPNALRGPAHQPGGNRNIQYGFGRFALAEGEALLVEFDRPPARLWGIQWLLDPWYETSDIANRFTGIPGGEAFVNGDERIRVVLAAGDPGVPNWLDVSGYAKGLFVLRWIWCQQGPPVALTVLPFAGLRERLPVDTPAVSPAERHRLLQRRRVHFASRRR